MINIDESVCYENIAGVRRLVTEEHDTAAIRKKNKISRTSTVM